LSSVAHATMSLFLFVGVSFDTGAQTPVTSGIASVAAGEFHTCAVTTSGGVKCWGANVTGQLGDNSLVERHTPVNVYGLASGISAVSVGPSHSCALTTAGGVRCWGANANGQLGDNSTVDHLIPTNVSGLTSGVIAIAAAEGRTCALTTGGGVKCWGTNFLGQLGDGTTINRLKPVDVSGLTSGVAAIATGGLDTCALMNSGGVKCWGANFSGQLGNNSTVDSPVPVDVSGLSTGVTAIAAGDHFNCALTMNGGIKCWGMGVALGDNSYTDRLTPVDVSGLTSGVSRIAAGGAHTCAVLIGGAVKCWGDNYSGQLGDRTNTGRPVPGDVPDLMSGVVAIAAGGAGSHTCALVTGGGLKCWGANTFGQLGDNYKTEQLVPTNVSGLTTGVAAISAGADHNCAVTTGGGTKCWGANYDGQLGDNSAVLRSMPVDVLGFASGAVVVKAGGLSSCALTTANGVKCWGGNGSGQLGNGTTSSQLVAGDVYGLTSGVSAISVGAAHSCAVTAGGVAKCWGANFIGQLGDNSIIDRDVPTDVVGLGQGVSTIAAGSAHTCALTSVGGLKCWGNNSGGSLGNNSNINSPVPVDVAGLNTGVSAIAVSGHGATCALTNAGGVKCWGANFAGQLGDNTTTDRLIPVDVSGLSSGVTAIAIGEHHTCALTNAGVVKCWGWNFAGQLGDNTRVDRLTPADVSGLSSGVIAIAAGADDTCALTVSGAVKCWGTNSSGQLGIGTAGMRPFPDFVLEFPSGLELTGVQSRKQHGTAGIFNLDVDYLQPLSGPVTTELRAIGGGHLIVFRFNTPIATIGNVSAVDSVGVPLDAISATINGDEVRVKLSNVPDNLRVKISIAGINNALDVSASIGFLLGDVNGTRSVTSSDINGVKRRSGQPVTTQNFTMDLNLDGKIDVSDLSMVKAHSGRKLLP